MIDAALRRFVRGRAGDRCEYCRLPQFSVDATFHVEHVRPKQHGGSSDAENLALACDRCNLHKGPNLTGIDPLTDSVALLVNPRRDQWDEHFELGEALVVGKTPVGRATVELLQMNAWRRRQLRAALLDEGRW